MAEVHIIGVQFRQPANQPVLLLRESAGDRYLPIWIGDNEAKAIMLEQQGVEPPRPLTHDLFRVSARPSDSVALALRMGVPIHVEDAVLDEAGLLMPDDSDEGPSGTLREDEVEKFKEFLDSVSPDDFKAI